MKGLAARKLAVEVLTSVETDKAYVNLALSAAFKRKSLSERDRAFVTALVQGVVRHRDELDAAIALCSKRPLKKLLPPVRNLLRVAVFQLEFMSGVPPRAVLDTAADIGRLVGHAGIPHFVTGVLRAYLRRTPAQAPAQALEADGQSDDARDARALSKQYSVPSWLVENWLAARGRQETEALLAWSQSIPPLTLRTCTSGITVEALARLLADRGIKTRRGLLADSCLIVEDRGVHKGPVSKLPGYKEGLFVVQDEPAAFAAQALAPRARETVVDLCAAPGGKAVYLAEMMEGKGKVIAVDIHERRLNLLKETRNRVGLTNIETCTADGTTFDPGVAVDRVLIDAPCTGTGVINRRSDWRLQTQPPDMAALVDLQRRLLARGAAMLKPGGFLVYSTCSIEPQENEQNILRFLDEHQDFKLVSLLPEAGAAFRSLPEAAEFSRGYVQLLPTRHGMSGFFVAKMQKQPPAL